MEALSNLLMNATLNRSVSGITVCRRSPIVTHLFFANDSMIFGKAQGLEARKSAVLFSKNTGDYERAEICRILGINSGNWGETYLGMPLVSVCSKRQIFSNVKEKVLKKISNWKNKLLSITGREVLIKAVTQAISTYVMSCFKLPNSLCSEIDSTIAKFWQGGTENAAKIHWKSRNSMCI
ncbi:PREDICTED: uncharacterized protein LOC108662780 [Theobroma cacao]|uniref:Uncharacterized protein LOC108662780 n=1 Tax=Theobroma cacao TaxID=3641 RepID=A0AB32WJS0_THECC|nr:PREDICTED: uncharacterized protein LOC108662780 [Theobroma cacao]